MTRMAEHIERLELENAERATRIAELQAENAKLRELVRALAYCMCEDCDCDRCALNGADMPTPRISACDELPEMLRELGIEVDG